MARVGGSLCAWHRCPACATVHANNRSSQLGVVRTESLQIFSQSCLLAKSPWSVHNCPKGKGEDEDEKEQRKISSRPMWRLNFLLNLHIGARQSYGLKGEYCLYSMEKQYMDMTVMAEFLMHGQAKSCPHERELKARCMIATT